MDDAYVAPFKNKSLDDTTEKVYAMVKNLDDNVGRLLSTLKRTNLDAKTILIFMTDNGPQQPRYVAGMRGLKGSVYQGGIRVPFFLRWPGTVAAGAKVDRIAAHIDVLPTLLDACAIRPAQQPRFDGRNLMPLLHSPTAPWPDRVIHTQWHRGDQPQIYRNHAARSQRWKLTNGTELYDMQNDPGETRDLAIARPDEVARLRAATETWFGDVSSTRGGYAPPRIYIGVPEENPTLLTLQDRRDEPEGWEVDVRSAARYQITLLFKSTGGGGEARLSVGRVEEARPVAAGAERCVFDSVAVAAGEARLAARVVVGGKPVEVRYVEVRKLNG